MAAFHQLPERLGTEIRRAACSGLHPASCIQHPSVHLVTVRLAWHCPAAHACMLPRKALPQD